MFMYHENSDSLDGSHFSKGWKGKRIYSANDLANLVKKYPNSPCLWAKGVRSKKNFRIAEWIGLDFDEGLSLENAIKAFNEYLCVIGTTKSHGVEKRGVTHDRFRVFIKLNEACRNPHDYEETVKLLIKKYGADKACSDAGRFFFPCKTIELCNYSGKVLPIVDSTKIVEKRKERNEKLRKESLEMNQTFETIPHHIKHKLRYGIGSNYSRNTACFQIGADLGCLNYSSSEIVALIQKSAIPGSKENPLTKSEITRQVKNGMNK
jgi:hypothetical protein